MSDAQVRALIAERNKMRAMLQSIDAELSNAVGQWSREHGFLVKLTPEQVLRELQVPA
jgi:hypothetical protein